MTTQRLVLAGVTANTAVGSLFAWSLVSEEAARDVGITAGGAATVFAVAIVVMTMMLLATGHVQRVGPRPLLLLAGVAAGGGLGLAASWQHPLGLWLGVAGLFGAANGVAYSVATTLASRVPSARRGTATGLVVAAYAGAPVALGVVGPSLIADHGWRACTAVLGLVAGVLLLLAATLAPAASSHARLADGSGVTEPAPPGTLPWLWLLFAGGTAPALMLFAHAAPLAALRGLDLAAAGLAVSVLAGGNLSGRALAGWASDVVGRTPSLAVALGAPALALAAVAWGGGVALIGGYAVLGFCYGAVSALVPAATADLVGVEAFPRAYARVFSAWGVAGLAGPVAGSGLVRLGADTPAVLLLAVLPLLLAGLALWVLSRPARRAASPRRRTAREVGRGQDHL